MKISLFSFSPDNKPPSEIEGFVDWWENETQHNPEAVPFASYDVNGTSLEGGAEEHKAFALKLLEIKKSLESVYNWFKGRN